MPVGDYSELDDFRGNLPQPTSSSGDGPPFIPKSIIDAAGDLIVGTADNTPSRLAPGSNTQVLTMVAGVPAWAAAGSSALSVGNSVFVDADPTIGNDGTGTRERFDKPFLTIDAAVSAAVSGDTVYVRRGTYTCGNLLKNGVNLHFDGCVVDGGLAENGIFDDSETGANQACTAVISGTAKFVIDAGELGLTFANITQASSHVVIYCESSPDFYVNQSEGFVEIHADRIGDINWANGESHAHVSIMRTITCIAASAANTKHVHVYADRIENIEISGASSASRFWVYVHEVQGACICDNAVVYLKALKLAYGFKLAQTGSNSDYWIETQKATALASSGSGPICELNGGKSVVTIQGIDRSYPGIQDNSSLRVTGGTHVVNIGRVDLNATGTKSIEVTGGTIDLNLAVARDSLGGSSNLLSVSGGTCNLGGLNFVSITSAGIAISAGTLRIKDGVIDTSGNSAANPITITGGTLKSAARLLSNGSRKCIVNGNAGTYTVDAWGGSANNNVDAGITANGLVVDSTVT